MLITGHVLRWGADLCIAGATLGCLYILTAAFLVLRFRSSPRNAASTSDPVTIFVPLCGHEPGLYWRLSALCDQDYGGPAQILCGTLNPADTAIEVVRQVAAERPHQTIELHVEPLVHGHNLKISNLINMAKWARYDTFVLIDSDIEVGPDYLSSVIGDLQKSGVGAVTCLYHGRAAGSRWARLAAMGINTHFLPNVIVALTFGLARPCFGATIAMSRDTLRRIGGFGNFVDQLWDDYAIGEAVRGLGLEVAVSHLSLAHVCTDGSAYAFYADQVRYARTIRSIDPIGYAGGVITHPLPLALLALLLGGGQEAFALAVAAWTCRTALSWSVARRFKAPANIYWLVVSRDILSFLVYVTSYFGATVQWRGNHYQLSDHEPVDRLSDHEPIADAQ